MRLLERRSPIAAAPEVLYAWHARDGAFSRLVPPWTSVQLVGTHPGVHVGSRVRLRVGPLGTPWLAEHTEVEPGRRFVDVQVSGPFRHWRHEHVFEPAGAGSTLVDRVEWDLFPGLGPIAAHVAAELEATFAWRHALTAGDLAVHAPCLPRALRVAVTGARGFLGSALVPYLTAGGHAVRVLRRGAEWDPGTGRVERAALAEIDAVIHLAGEPVAGGPWTEGRRRRIRESRVDTTALLARTLAAMEGGPRVLVCASAVGIFGDRGDEVLDERAPPGHGYLADVGRAWEAAADPAREAGVRVVCLRFGLVLSPEGGFLRRLLPAFQVGLGGRLGTGMQWISWIARDDALDAIHLALTQEVAGVIHAVAPEPVRQGDFAQALAAVLGRPLFGHVPAAALRALPGGMADELLLASARVVSRRLREAGFVHRWPDLRGALGAMRGRPIRR